MLHKKYIATTALLVILLLPFTISMQGVYAVDDLETENTDTIVLSSGELEELGFPANSLVEKRDVDPAEIFSDDSAITKNAQKELLEGSIFFFKPNSGENVVVGIRIEILSTSDWAKITKKDKLNVGKSGFENTPSYWLSEKNIDGIDSWYATTAKGRIRISVLLQKESSDSTISDKDFDKLGLDIFNSQIQKAPILVDLPNHKTVDISQERMMLGILFGALVFIFPILSSLFSVFYDRGSRERINPKYQYNRKRACKPKAFTVNLTRKETSSFRGNMWVFLRSFLSGILCSSVYFFTGKMKSIGMMAIIGGIIFIVTIVTFMIKMRNLDQESTVFASNSFTFKLGIIAIMGSTAIYIFGILIIFLGLTGILFVYTYAARCAAIALMLYGAIVLTNTGRPIRFAERLLAPYKKLKIDEDPRKEVLLLRSFQDDDLMIRVHRESRHSLMEQITLQRLERFEELLAWNLWHFGPVRAIGQPGTILEPLGAVRNYYDDDEWQSKVESMMSEAKIITLVVGRSPSLLWEITKIKSLGKLGNCMFVLPPVDREEASKRLQVLASALEVTPASLGLDSSGMTQCPITVLYFNEKAEPVVVTGPARDDISYQAAIRIAASNLDERAIDPMNTPSVNYHEKPSSDITQLLMTFEEKPKRKRNKTLHFLFDVFLGQL